jgi:hypothetical protein
LTSPSLLHIADEANQHKHSFINIKPQNGSPPNYSVEFKEEIIVNTPDGKASSVENITVYEVEKLTLKSKLRYDAVYALTVIIIICSIMVAAVGLFDVSDGASYSFINQYGDIVKLYGKGIYRHDSFFRAPIFRGTDFTMLFVACPLLMVAFTRDLWQRTLKTRLLLTSVIASFMYYAVSIAFGVTYNELQLVYILLFAASFFGLIAGMISIDVKEVEKHVTYSLPYKGIYWFLIITGMALYAAWLPDIITALIAKRPLQLIENYTTEITYVLDMGIIAPACFICFYLLKHRKGLGYVLLDMLLTLCIVIGIMLPVQTIFQLYEGITIPLPALITKLGSFCVLAMFALYFKIQVAHSIADSMQQ